MNTNYSQEQLIKIAELRTRKGIISNIEVIFRDEFSDVSKALMASTLAGLIELVKRGEFLSAKILIGGVTEIPPGVTQQRFDEVKSMLLALFP